MSQLRFAAIILLACAVGSGSFAFAV